MMEAVCVGMCGCGCGGNKSNVLATLMNTVSHAQCGKLQGCHVTISEALNEEMHKQRHSLTTGTPLVTAR